MTILCDIAFKYGTDKCPQLKHHYTPYYYELFKDRRETVKKVVEVGIGWYPGIKYFSTVYDPRLNRTYCRGASLLMWRDFFPNAQIHGVDVSPETMFEAERITTHVCDTRNAPEIEALLTEIGPDVDLFIDDGSHLYNHQAFLAKTAMPLLNGEVVYIIEDVRNKFTDRVAARLADYDCVVPDIRRRRSDDSLIMVKHKDAAC